MKNPAKIHIITIAASLLLGGAALFPASADVTQTTTTVIVTDEPLSTGSPRMVLKNGNTLLVLDKTGMIDSRPGSPYGLYENDTRFLSRWQLYINGKLPNLLAAFTRDGYQGQFLYGIGDEVLIERELVVLNGLSERITIHSYIDKPVELRLEIPHEDDYKDMFEVRGAKQRSSHPIPVNKLNTLWDAQLPTNTDDYLGLDGILRQTFLTVERKPSEWSAHNIAYNVTMPPHSTQTFEFRIDTSNTPKKMRSSLTFSSAKDEALKEYSNWIATTPHFMTDWPLLNDMLEQSWRDLYLLRQTTPKGPCLAAGLPWYSCAFGRDQCITALQTLQFVPELSRDVLQVLAAYQGKKHDSFTEEEPGRIMHELRLGEMANCKEIAFIPYYGTVDATPLWLMLLSRYVDATGDIALGKELWPNVEAALSYIDRCTQANNGFLYYGGKEGAALSNQAWKDSGDSIMHKDGTLATPPIAVCEVQGYLYDAYLGAAGLATRIGNASAATKLNEKAKKLKDNFRRSFWLPDQKIIALALDGTAKPCDVVSSNPGHLLNTGIIDGEMADAVSSRLMKDDMFSGWGIRTLSSREVRYNPISYHDGTIWPHDNGMIVEGMAARGKMQEASVVMESLIESAKSAPDARLPELFAGFPRSEFRTPVPYAVSCVPQAWASGSVVQMLKSVLGINLVDGKVKIVHPRLPKNINYVTVSGLRSGGAKTTVTFKKDPASGKVSVTSSSKDISIQL